VKSYIACSGICMTGVKCTQPATKRSGYKYCKRHESHYRRAEKGSMARTGKPTGMTSTVEIAMEKFLKDPHIHNLRSELGVLRSLLSDYTGVDKKELTLPEKAFMIKLIKQITDLSKISQELEEKCKYLVSAVYFKALVSEMAQILKKYVTNPDTLATIVGEIKQLPWQEVSSFEDMSNRYENTAPQLANPQMNVTHVNLEEGELSEREEQTPSGDE
jgi:hypothetical protein